MLYTYELARIIQAIPHHVSTPFSTADERGIIHNPLVPAVVSVRAMHYCNMLGRLQAGTLALIGLCMAGKSVEEQKSGVSTHTASGNARHLSDL